MLLNEM
jgi:hypothetical protein